MKKVFFLTAIAAISILAVSCSKEENKDVQTFKATAEQAADDSKISLSGLSLRWSAGDEISVYDNAANNAVYTLSSGAGTANGEFSHSSGSTVSTAPYSAVYPASIRTGANTVLIPSHQDSPDGTLSSLPMYAVGDDMNLKFYHLCGVVRFRLSATSPVSLSFITVTTNSSINGAATITGSGTSVRLSTPSGGNTMVLSLDTPQDISSAKEFYMYLPAGNYSSIQITLTAEGGATCTKTASSAIVVERAKVTTITLTGQTFGVGLPEGALSGEFSVAAGRTVHFSQGNLQYKASTSTWRFATNQYDYVGSANSNISSTYTGWIDLFGWGTSGWNSGANCYQPWLTNTNYVDYYPGGTYINNLTGSYANADWGVYNAISNGGNAAGVWRTLTNSELNYLLNSRNASTINGVSNARHARGKVAGVVGVILFPDSYTHPVGVTAPTNININNANFTDNNYSTSDWVAMQIAGAVFLPAAGYRYGTMVYNVGSYGALWSSTYYDYIGADGVDFGTSTLYTSHAYNRNYGFSVRLVRD